MKSLKGLLEELINNHGFTPHSLEELAWHIRNGDKPIAISLACSSAQYDLAPVIAEQLNDLNPKVREVAISELLGRFRLAQYAENGLYLALTDPDEGVRVLALANLGEVLYNISDKNLQRQVASLLIETLETRKYRSCTANWREISAAYDSILAAIDILPLARPSPMKKLDFESDINLELVERFKEQYLTEKGYV